jgi:hypothetical protein
MDPITRAMWELIGQADAFWRANPNRLLPLVAHEDQREDMVQALRLYEARPENRRLVMVFGAPFTTASAYFPQLTAHIARHYEIVRKGAAEQGVELAPLGSEEGTVPSGTMKRAVLAIDTAARQLGERFDGIVVALIPDHVADEPGWRESVRVLAATRWAPRVRLAVFAPSGGPLSEVIDAEGAHLRINPSAMLAFLKQRAPEAEAPGAKLQALLVGAAEAMGAARPIEAATLYREARALCQAEQLLHQEAAVLMALGGACVAGQAPELAAANFGQAAVMAETLEQWSLACQAWLGAGGAHLAGDDHVASAVAYRAAAVAAEHAEMLPLRVEALRMLGTCLLRLGRKDDALLTWKEAVDIGTKADVAERHATTLHDVAQALATLLERQGLDEQARHVRRLAVHA